MSQHPLTSKMIESGFTLSYECESPIEHVATLSLGDKYCVLSGPCSNFDDALDDLESLVQSSLISELVDKYTK